MTDNRKLLVPALKAKMGDNIYYVCFLRLRDIAERVSFAQDIHKSERLRELIQRQVTNRSKEIGTYLVTQPQRFFNALTVGVYGGAPDWYEISIKKSQQFDPRDLPAYLEGASGLLVLDGSERLFAIDGQHRVAGIKDALKRSQAPEGLAEEEVCTIFLSADVRQQEGLERTRRLFTTLNRYAKPVSMMDIIAQDEDDVIAITTRQLVESCPLFQERRLSMTRGKMIPVTDADSFTTIETLYQVLDIVLADRRIGWNKFKRFRPTDDVLSHFCGKGLGFWNLMVEKFPPLAEVRDGTGEQKIAGKHRNKEGGHLLFRPVGLLAVARALKMAGNGLFLKLSG